MGTMVWIIFDTLDASRTHFENYIGFTAKVGDSLLDNITHYS